MYGARQGPRDWLISWMCYEKRGGLGIRTGSQGLPFTGGEVGLGGEEQQFVWERTEFGVPIRNPPGNAEKGVGLSSGERFRLETEMGTFPAH